MRQRLYLLRRRGIFYVKDSTTQRKDSLGTRDRKAAETILFARRHALEQPSLNLALGKAFLSAHDQHLPQRTWSAVMEEFCRHGKPSTQERNGRAVNSKPFRLLRDRKIIETRADEFLAVLNAGGPSTAHFLRRLHNLALGLGWLPWPVLDKKLWPKLRHGQRRGITLEEYQRILTAERDPEWRRFYEVLFHAGTAQTDGANLRAESIDWDAGVLAYQRQKSEEWAYLRIGNEFACVLKQLPQSGLLFPSIAPRDDSQRAWHFSKVRGRAGIEKGVTLHSYRYGWAERANAAGMPERFAMKALGHSSRAVHQAYAKKAHVVCPSLEEYERQAQAKIIALPDVRAKTGT